MSRRITALVINGFTVGAMAIPLLAAPALAQTAAETVPTRARLLDAAREALTSAAAPPTRSMVERVLVWYDNQYLLARILRGWKGLRVGGGDLPAGAGLTLGVAYDRALTTNDPDPALPNRAAVELRGAHSTRGYRRVSGGFNVRNLAGQPVDAEAFGQYYEYPQEDHFGTGMHSLESNRTNFRLETIETGAAVHWRPHNFDLGGGASYLRPRVGRGTDSRSASIEDVFQPAATPGLESKTDFVRIGASAALDWRDNRAYPHSGGRLEVGAARFDAPGLDRFDFDRLDVHLEHHLPLGSRYRTLAVRAVGAFTDPRGAHSVPFYLLPTLGGHSDLRGFRESRFRDRNTVLLGAEYRWQAWWALDAALFVDAATAAPSRRQLALDTAELSYGVGFRLHSNSALVGRLDLAFSREGFIPILRLEHVF